MNDVIIRLLYPFGDFEKIKKVLNEKVVPPPLPDFSMEINDVIDTLYPIDAVTGNRSSDITRLLMPGITAMEKDRILASLQKMPTSKRNNLSDEDLINMLPSRYNSTLVDLDKVRDFYEENIFSELDKDKDNNSSFDNSSSDNSNVE